MHAIFLNTQIFVLKIILYFKKNSKEKLFFEHKLYAVRELHALLYIPMNMHSLFLLKFIFTMSLLRILLLSMSNLYKHIYNIYVNLWLH